MDFTRCLPTDGAELRGSSPRGPRHDDALDLGCVTFIHEVSGDDIKLAPRRTHIVVHQDAAATSSGGVGDIQCGSQFRRCRPLRSCRPAYRLSRRARLHERPLWFDVERPLAEHVLGRCCLDDAFRVTE